MLSEIGTQWSSYSRSMILCTWIFNCLILLTNEYYRGYDWSAILNNGWTPYPDWLEACAKWLERHRGLTSWYGLFNLVVLRMISFNIDRIWAKEGRPIVERDGNVLTFHKHTIKCTECRQVSNGLQRSSTGGSRPSSSSATYVPCPWWREKEHHSELEYNFITYFVYLFYLPLHFAGPTITFNSFLSHIKLPQQTYSNRGLAKYFLIKTVFIFLLLEWWLHYLYVFSFTNSSTFRSLSPYAMAMTSYYTLVGIWLKFTAIWRYFRCWALFDGVEPPENMQRCVSNNYSIQAFWRAWHRSFNRWLIRYIYVPLGGASSTTLSSSSSPSLQSRLFNICRQSLNIFLTFSFVAFWHDRTLQLLTWGWLIALLFIPELTAQAVFNMKSLRWIKKKWYWRHVQGVGAAISIFYMMASKHNSGKAHRS